MDARATVVFTAEWLETVERKWGHLPGPDRPDLYRVVTNPKAADYRDRLEAAVSQLSPKEQWQLIPRLREPRLHFQAWNELVVAEVLRQRGYGMQYERQIGGVTPDWYVSGRHDVPDFVVEVFSSMPPKDAEQTFLGWDYLTAHLRTLPFGVALHVAHERNMTPIPRRKVKRLVRDVEAWLSGNPGLNERFESDGVQLTVVMKNDQWKTVEAQGPIQGMYVNPAPLRKSISDKIKRYGKLRKLGYPLVVAVVADFLMGYGLDDLDDVLHGTESVTFTFTPEGQVVGAELGRKQDGLIHRNPDALSAVLWIEHPIGQPTVSVRHNPRAAIRLPEGFV